uniref:Phlebovirus glycoprotein G2 fusion domain-containing protein n=2 Tax=Caenorhabditis tropicalis TaxID=1561998 RepID=A0A1I7TT52_9PELO
MDAEIPIIPNRLLNPANDKSVEHFLINPLDQNNLNQEEEIEFRKILMLSDSSRQEEYGLRKLVKLCSSPHQLSELPFRFPRFLCGLLFVYREPMLPRGLNFTQFLFPRISDAIRSLNNVQNYPCHSMKMSDVVALSEGRIFSGCINETNSQNPSHFDSAFIMSHPFPIPQRNCTEYPICEVRSALIQHKILYQQENCCCEGEMCAYVIYTQTASLTPLIIKSVDLKRMSSKRFVDR